MEGCLGYNAGMRKKGKIGGRWAGRIPEFARRIGEAARARRVILFGSAARGEMGKHSDLDFLVVIPERCHRWAAWKRANNAACEIYRAEYPTPPMEFVITTEKSIRKWRDCPFVVIKPAMDEGVEVWRADDA